MRLVNISEITVTLDLEPDDCVLLARACRSAREAFGSQIGEERTGLTLDAIAVGLEAAAMACEAATDTAFLAKRFPGDFTLASARAKWAEDRHPGTDH